MAKSGTAPSNAGVPGRSSRAPAAVSAGMRLRPLPDECWLRVFTFLEATELSGAAAQLSAASMSLANQPDLWIALLYIDFCASLATRELLRSWLDMPEHCQLHPRLLYVYKRNEHVLDLSVSRLELQQRGEQVREQERKQRRLRVVNFILVRVMHLMVLASLLATSMLLWLRLGRYVHWKFCAVFSPIFVLEAFTLLSSALVFTAYGLRGSSRWSWYWPRLRGFARWLILYTTIWESLVVILLGCTVVPLLALELDGYWPPSAITIPVLTVLPSFISPFACFWLTMLCLAWGLLRRRAFSASCVGSFVMLWSPAVAVSVLLFLKLTSVPHMAMVTVFAPSLFVVGLLLVFVSFLVIASFWLGYRGSRDWAEYATVTLLAALTMLLPMMLLQVAVLMYIDGMLSANAVFIPWVVWLSGVLCCSIWHMIVPPSGASGVPPIDQIARPWARQQDRDSQSDTEPFLSVATAAAGGIV